MKTIGRPPPTRKPRKPVPALEARYGIRNVSTKKDAKGRMHPRKKRFSKHRTGASR